MAYKFVVQAVLCLGLMISVICAQNCSDMTFSNNQKYTTCNSLPALNSFLHWNYHQSNHSIDIAYRHRGVRSSGWVAWAINPTGRGMVGAQALVALRSSSGLVNAYTAPVLGYDTQLRQGPLSFRVERLSTEFNENDNETVIYASIQLPSGRTSFQQVWQNGPVSGDTPIMHEMSRDNMRSVGNIDFVSGLTTDTRVAVGGGSRQRKRIVHGVINVASWGILMPIGAMVARYMKVFKVGNPAWFYLHVGVQVSAYSLGVAGWGTGLKLGSDSPGVCHDTHRNIGITLFALATLQVFALVFRPKPDHKLRLYWNLYHWSIGYTVIVLSIVNIFKGLDILDPGKNWKMAYIGVLIFLGAIAALLEAFTWYIVLHRKRQTTNMPTDNGASHNSNIV